MVCKTSLSNMFRGLPITDDFIHSMIEKPVTDNGKQIGTIIGVNLETDTISMEIDDGHLDKFVKTSGLEIVGER